MDILQQVALSSITFHTDQECDVNIFNLNKNCNSFFFRDSLSDYLIAKYDALQI